MKYEKEKSFDDPLFLLEKSSDPCDAACMEKTINFVIASLDSARLALAEMDRAGYPPRLSDEDIERLAEVIRAMIEK